MKCSVSSVQCSGSLAPFSTGTHARLPIGNRQSAIGNILSLCVALLMPCALSGRAETTNDWSDAEIQGHALVQKILQSQPAENQTNSGVLQIKAKGQLTKLPVTWETLVTATNWSNRYLVKRGETNVTTLVVTHAGTAANQYQLGENGVAHEINGRQAFVPLAGSDFWLGDLGLEFFHWPGQKIVKKEFHRQCACAVVESTNPDPHGYSRVVCWIDEESLGIVEAYAYDAQGQKLKNFYPKSLEKVNGQYRVESMIMENLQTDSTSRLEFDFNGQL